jgi:hypothetical protein
MTEAPVWVSVVLGVHDDAEGVRATLESLATQDLDSFEVVVVNDGSQDATASVLAELGESLKLPLRVVVHEENRGLTRSLIDGCAAARGELIARIDAGDRARPSRLRRQAEFLSAHSGCVLVGSALQFIGPSGEPLWIETYPDGPCRLFEPGVGGPHHASVMFRAADYSAAGGYRPDFYYAQDHDLWYRLLEHGELRYLQEPLTEIRIDASGISARRGAEQTELSELARQCASRRARGEPEDDLLAVARSIERTRSARSAQEASFGLHYYIGSRLLQRRDGRALGYLRKALGSRPWSIRAWAKVLVSAARRIGRSGTLRDHRQARP